MTKRGRCTGANLKRSSKKGEAMNMLNIGGRFINLDNVTEIHEGEDYDGNWRVDVWFNCRGSDGQSKTAFKGDAGRVLLSWLGRNSVDIKAPEHHDDEYREYQDRGGDLGYESWKNTKNHLAECLKQPEAWFDIKGNQELVMRLESYLMY